MTEDEALAALLRLDGDDNEAAHREADKIIIQLLRDNGFKRVADAWDDASRSIGFWYA